METFPTARALRGLSPRQWCTQQHLTTVVGFSSPDRPAKGGRRWEWAARVPIADAAQFTAMVTPLPCPDLGADCGRAQGVRMTGWRWVWEEGASLRKQHGPAFAFCG